MLLTGILIIAFLVFTGIYCYRDEKETNRRIQEAVNKKLTERIEEDKR